MEHLPGYEDIGILLEWMDATIERATPRAQDRSGEIHEAIEKLVSSEEHLVINSI